MFRREMLRAGVGTAAMTVFAAAAASCAPTPPPRVSLDLQAADANGVMLPEGFRSRVIARSQSLVRGTSYWWHADPDGGAVFEDGDGWIYVSNSESFPGGVGAIVFDAAGEIRSARPLVLGLTLSNCAGGATPWGTWLSCEEWDYGRVLECDPTGRRNAIDRPALGWFTHEAVAVDPGGRALYLTEDRPDGCLYRFVPERWGDLRAGTLSVAIDAGDDRLDWAPVPQPNPTLFGVPTRHQVRGAKRFDGGEGAVFDGGDVFFTTKGDNRVWALETATMQLSVRYDGEAADGQLQGVDNITAAEGSVYVAEDGGDMELVLVDPNGRTAPCLRVVGHEGSEIAGPAFDPSGRRLYFSSQRGPDGRGVTYEVTGPFDEFRRSFASSVR